MTNPFTKLTTTTGGQAFLGTLVANVLIVAGTVAITKIAGKLSKPSAPPATASAEQVN